MTPESLNIEKTQTKGVADLIFCFDSSASMATCIDHLKMRVLNSIESLNNSAPATVSWRTKIMGFRDFNVDVEKIINNKFTTDINEVKSQLSQIAPYGGGDEFKSGLDAMWYALKETDWRPRCRRVLVMFTDSSTHPIHQDTIDRFDIMGDQEFLMQEIGNEKIKLFLFAKDCEPYEDMQMVPSAVVTLYNNPIDKLCELEDDIFDSILKIPVHACPSTEWY